MTETPFGRDGTTSAASAHADVDAPSAHVARGQAPVRRRPQPKSEGVPADTLALLVLLVVILVVVLLGASVA